MSKGGCPAEGDVCQRSFLAEYPRIFQRMNEGIVSSYGNKNERMFSAADAHAGEMDNLQRDQSLVETAAPKNQAKNCGSTYQRPLSLPLHNVSTDGHSDKHTRT